MIEADDYHPFSKKLSLYKLQCVALRFYKREDKKELLSLTDEQLVARYSITHDNEIIGILYERYTHLLFSVCYKYLHNDADAEDMVMLVFEKLFVHLKK